MNIISLTKGTLLSAGLTLTAFAQTDPSFSWTGFYAGVQGGTAFMGGDKGILAFDTDLDGVYDDSIAAFGDSLDGSFDSDASIGAHFGYDHQMSNWVLGALVDYNSVDIRQRQSGFSSTPAFYHDERSVDALGTLRLRVGYLFTERLLGYVTGGLAYADDEYRAVTNTPATVAFTGGNDDTAWAWGTGMEARVTERVSLGIEYLYYDLGEPDLVTNYSGPAAFSGVAGSTDARGSDRTFDFHTIQAKLSFRF